MLTRLLRSFLARDGIFVNDVGEVALLGAVPLLPVAVDHLDLAHLGSGDHHLAGGRRPFPGGTHLQRLVDGGDEHQPERGKQHRIDEPRQIGHRSFPQRRRCD